MPGVMLDLGAEDLSFASDSYSTMYNSSSPLGSPLLPQGHIGMQQPVVTRRCSSFNGKTHDLYSQLAPLSYTRSQSLINTSAIPQAFNSYYSLPSTPSKMGDMGVFEGIDDMVVAGDGDGGSGYGSLDSALLSGAYFVNEGRAGSPGSSRGMPSSPTTLENAQMMTVLHKYLSNNNEDEESWAAVDVYACDEFRMFEFKVRRCMRGRSHDWTECPFAHPGEKARRRDPRRFHYSGTACPDFRKGSCRRGDACEFAHGVFECWLHPARYRTQPCKDGRSCRRRVCFFAHTQEQLRLLPGAAQAANVARNVLTGSQATALAACLSLTPSSHSLPAYDTASPRYNDGSPRTSSVAGSFDGGISFDGSRHLAQSLSFNGSHYASYHDASGGHCCGTSQVSSPTSTLVGHTLSPPPLSPPLSPPSSAHTSSKGMSDLIATLQQLDIRGGVPPIWLQAQAVQAASAAQYSSGPSPLRRCSQSVPCTPTKLRWEGKESDKPWEVPEQEEEEVGYQRVESGRDLRAKIYGKVGKENRMDAGDAPDLGWVNELVQEDAEQSWFSK